MVLFERYPRIGESTQMATTTKANTGEIVQIIGPVLDVQFAEGHLPEIFGALRVKHQDGTPVIAGVQQHLGNNWVRAVAMSSTDGLRRGLPVEDLGGPMTAPVGLGTLGRLLNVIGEPIDDKGPLKVARRDPIHREAPTFEDQATSSEVLETGIKMFDLICPFLKGGKTAVLGG